MRNGTDKRRRWLRLLWLVVLIPVIGLLCILYARFVEPVWVKVKQVELSDTPTVTLIHISDIHYKGDRAYLARVARIVNGIDADFVCFTGDLVEQKRFLKPALDILREINKPLCGIPGNHDDWAHIRKSDTAAAFAATGGRWLTDGETVVFSNLVAITGEVPLKKPSVREYPGLKRILLCHYPHQASGQPPGVFDLLLAGHTHGGQVRLPFIRNSIVQPRDMAYDKGLFRTKAGPLYVNPGLGTYYLPIRFMCRPEITVISF